MADKLEKIKKTISSALNNPNAFEAAKALKTAAATMHEMGVNPRDFLLRKAEVIEELESLRTGYATLKRSFDDEQRRVADLENALASARGNPADLREAKELAIKWHRTSRQQDEKLAILHGRIKKLAILSVIIAIGGYIIGGTVAHHSASLHADSLLSQISAKDKQISALLNQTTAAKPGNKRKAEPQSKPVTSRNGVYTLKADCINASGNKFSPVWTVNTSKYEVEESTKILANGYSLSLSGKAIPANGQRFKLTYQGGYVINCTVVDAQ